MGIDIHGLNFLRFASRKKYFGSVATIGRQALMIPHDALAKIVGAPGRTFGLFCEDLFKTYFSATSVHSYDYSDYEGATHVVDLNKPYTADTSYDTVIDCGCIEHIYNVTQALKNISTMCAGGGQIIHVLPANNFCGHGFWQFSPELFFSLYSKTNGYSDTQVFLADLRTHGQWFEVTPPSHGRRVEVITKSPVYVLCRTCKSSTFSHDDVQQSDYVHTWELPDVVQGGESELLLKVKRILRRSPLVHRATSLVYRTTKSVIYPKTLSSRNPSLKKRKVSVLVAG